jgi:hypothetical protein
MATNNLPAPESARHPHRLLPLWEWPAISWLITGLPMGALLGFGLDGLAIHQGWWSDPSGIWGGVLTLTGVMIGALMWWGLIALSYRQRQGR